MRSNKLAALPRWKAALALLGVAFLLSGSAGAVGLDDVHVLSMLGERFRAEIPLLNASGPIEPGCFHLASEAPDAVGEVPWLIDAQIAVLASPPRLQITSRQPVVDPVLQMAIFTGCGTYLTRHFTMLMSPPHEKDGGMIEEPRLATVPAARTASSAPVRSAPPPATSRHRVRRRPQARPTMSRCPAKRRRTWPSACSRAAQRRRNASCAAWWRAIPTG